MKRVNQLFKEQNSTLQIWAEIPGAKPNEEKAVYFSLAWYRGGIKSPEFRERKMISTKIKVKKKYFNPNPTANSAVPQWIKPRAGTRSIVAAKNEEIFAIWERVLALHNERYTAAQFTEVWNSPASAETVETKSEFWEAFAKYNRKARKNKVGIQSAFSTFKNYSDHIRPIQTWTDLDLDYLEELIDRLYWGEDMDKELRSKVFQHAYTESLAAGTLRNMLGVLKRFVTLSSESPKIKAPKSVKDFVNSQSWKDAIAGLVNNSSKDYHLTEEEIAELAAIKFKTKLRAKTNSKYTEQLIVDLFLVGCYEGARYSDLRRIEGGMLPEFDEKTGHPIIIRELLPETLEILAKYGGDNWGIELPKKSDVFNIRLREAFRKTSWSSRKVTRKISRKGGEEVQDILANQLTFHASRFSFATNRLNEGVEIHMISKKLNHADIDTTMKYLKYDKDRARADWSKVAARADWSKYRKPKMKVA